MISVYGYSPSGNCYKLRLLLAQLGRREGRDYRWIETDSSRGATRTPDFLARNPNGKVPLLEREDGAILTESNAILCWLAEGTPFLAGDAWQRAQSLSWLFFEQYSHEPYVAVARFICGWTPPDSPRRADLPRLRERAHAALAVMETCLARQAWFGGTRYGIADIALFAYSHCAEDGGIALAAYPRLRDWLDRVRATPGFVPLPTPAAENLALIAQSR
ncbi:MAG TPA: glutathione S-transferase family protein [Rhodanobacteraceae bacterium]|nr:glutathione S-transferase family protein [Rhodanobacteraceae bacterium]